MNEFLQKKWVKGLIWFGALGILSIGMSCPFLIYWWRGRGILFADDIGFHLNRLQSIADGIRGGQFPVWIYPRAMTSYGYGAPLFYPDLFLYPFAILVALNLQLMHAYFLMLVCCEFAMGATMFLLAKKFLPNFYDALLAACLYAVCQYVATDVIHRAAVGEILGLVFLPLILLGLWNMIKEDFSRPWILLLGVLGVTFSHTISLLLDGLLILAVTLCNAKTLFRSKRWWKKVGILIGFYVVIGGAYFFPMAEQFLSAKFNLSAWKPLLYDNALTVPELFTSLYGAGPFCILSLLLRLFVKKTEENAARVKLIDRLLAGIVLSLVLTMTIFPWKILYPLISLVQFAWRFNTYACPLFALYLVLVGKELIRSRRLFAVCGWILAASMLVYNLTYYPWREYFIAFDYNEAGAREWLPAEGNVCLDYSLYDDAGNRIAYDRDGNSVKIVFEADGSQSYRVPLLWYRGYTAVLVREDGTEQKLVCRADAVSGMIVETDGASGTVTVDYTGTAVQKIAYVVSGLGIVGAVACLIAAERKNHRRESEDGEASDGVVSQ